MNQAMLAGKPPKTHYSEHEAAEELGLSVDRLRALIRNHIIENDEDMNNMPMASLHASDLLVLKMLSGQIALPRLQG
jgi:hypothetical protein